MKIESVTASVIQKPISIDVECPYCLWDISIKYDEFIDIAGEPCDWRDTEYKCPECNKKFIIDYVDWN